MKEEIISLLKNGTWEVVPIPRGARILDCGFIFKKKPGNPPRYKGRLVARGNQQTPGVDFDQVYAPVSKGSTWRMLFAIAARDDLELEHWDVKTAFLNGDLEEEVYMRHPPGVELPPAPASS